ncbi:hypothetical protein PtB15_3B408 [Puccinia triticina]|nr:hypothetical protein PtB15_3B408 [Puccinia triticina]
MSMLLAVCPDIVLKITVGNCNRSQVTTRKAAFIESLRKHLKAVKMADVATACCVDLCKAATFFPKTTTKGPGLCLLALNLVSNLNARLLDPAKPFTNANGVVKIPLIVFEKFPAVLRLCGLNAKLSSVQLLATLQGLPNGGNGLGGRVAQAQRAKLIMCTIASNSPIINPIWDEALRFWKLLLRLVGHRPFKDGSGDTGLYNPLPALRPLSGEGENTNAWISISGLLTSIASIHDSNHPTNPRPPLLDHFIPPDLLHNRFYAVPDRARNVDR